MSFTLSYDKQPLKFLKNQDKHLVVRLTNKIKTTLPNNPVPHNSRSLTGKHSCFRIRVGDYRILYRINYQKKKIIIFKIDKRPRAYS